MIFEFFQGQGNTRVDVGDIVAKDDYNLYIVIETNDNDFRYALLDIEDNCLQKWFENLEEISQEYRIYRKKDEYKLVDNF